MFDEFGMSGAILVRPGRVWNASWLRLKASGEHLGGVLGRLEAFLEGFWRVLEASWELCGSIFCHFGQHAKIAKNLGKTMIFH